LTPNGLALADSTVVRLMLDSELVALAQVVIHGDASVFQPDKVFA
jgi:hypothetical protein